MRRKNLSIFTFILSCFFIFFFFFNLSFAQNSSQSFDYQTFFDSYKFHLKQALPIIYPIVNNTANILDATTLNILKNIYSQKFNKISSQQSTKINTEINNLIKSNPYIDSSQTANSTCNATNNNVSDRAECMRNIFQSCADSYYYKSDMQTECKSFPTQDYQNYIQVKDQYVQNPGVTPQPVSTAMGSVPVSPYIPSSSSGGSGGSVIPPSSYAPGPQATTQPIVQGEKEGTQVPWTGQDQTMKNGNTTAPAVTGEGWIENVWGTEYCTGEPCNPKTALGYSPRSCIVALPYKIIDTFFGTKTYECIQNNCRNAHKKGEQCNSQLGACLKPYYKLISGRMIEVKNLASGKMGVFPLGDVGPAGWTGNSIDFTSCSKRVIGMSGKGKFSFRPAPQGAITSK